MLVTDSLLAYILAATLLTLTPGLDTALVLRTATVEGGRKAFHAALGIDMGCFIWGALVAFGLGALLAVSEFAYTLLKWCGAAYLCWLGIQLLMRPRQQFSMHPEGAKPTNNWFLRGMMGNVLNPKMGIFYVSFLPQFIPGGHSPVVSDRLTCCNFNYAAKGGFVCRHHSVKFAVWATIGNGRSDVGGPANCPSD